MYREYSHTIRKEQLVPKNPFISIVNTHYNPFMTKRAALINEPVSFIHACDTHTPIHAPYAFQNLTQ